MNKPTVYWEINGRLIPYHELWPIVREIYGASSSGRISDFESEDAGSNPAAPTQRP